MKFSKILVTNQHTANFGDDAAGVTMAIQLRQQFPDTELHFVYNWPWEKSSFLAIPYQDNQTFHHHEILFQKTDLQDAIVYVATKFIPFIDLYNCYDNKTLFSYHAAIYFDKHLYFTKIEEKRSKELIDLGRIKRY
jgi:hypothetical protein